MPLPKKRDPMALAATVQSARCIRCSTLLKGQHQLIFDETGIELNLQNLLSMCFQLNIQRDRNKTQALCENCLNQLIEVYDVMEKESEDVMQQEEPSTSGIRNNCNSSTFEIIDIKNVDCNEDEFYTEDNLMNEIADGKVSIKDDGEENYSQDISILSGPNETDDDDGYEMYSVGKNENNLNDSNFDNDLNQMENDSQNDDNQDNDGQNDGDEKANEDEDEEFENVDYLEEYDDEIDFKEYKFQVLRSKFLDIMFPNAIKCCICKETLFKHVDIISHTESTHCIDYFAYPCIIDEKCDPLTSLSDLIFHLVFNHYDLENLTIYCHCPECSKRFNDFISYNKHSCYTGENISRNKTDCEICSKTFKSNKRYRFHQQFHAEKRRPKACFICDKLFRDEDEYFEHVMYKHEKNIGLFCLSCDRAFTSIENLEHHLSIHKIDRRYPCKHCNKSYLYKQVLKDHMISNHSKNSFKCHICGKTLIKKTLLNKHLLLHNKPKPVEVKICSLCGLIPEKQNEAEIHLEEHDEELNEPEILIETLDIAYCCEYCELAFNSIENMITHRNNHLNKKKYYCDMCPLSYDQYKKVKTHKITHYNYMDKRKSFPVVRHYVCDVEDCTMSYVQWTSLKSHKKHKHDSKSNFKCPKCLENFKNIIAFQNHMKNEHMGSAYDCEFCENKYSTKMALAVHMARKHNKNRFQCNNCEYSYPSEELLKKHINNIHQTFTCEVCGKLLKNLKNYRVHQRMVHKKEKRFFCQYCGKGYFNNCDKTDHEQAVHEKIEKYKCKICPYAAVYKESFIIHMRAHRNENPFVCKLCGRGFRRSYALELHTRRHYDIRNFVCPYVECGNAYPNQGILNSHLRQKHSDGVILPANYKPNKKLKISKIGKNRKDLLNDTFIDDDDGLDALDDIFHNDDDNSLNDSVTKEETQKPGNSKIDSSMPDVSNNLENTNDYTNLESIKNGVVIVQINEIDHDYIVRSVNKIDDENIIEEYEVIEEDIT